MGFISLKFITEMESVGLLFYQRQMILFDVHDIRFPFLGMKIEYSVCIIQSTWAAYR